VTGRPPFHADSLTTLLREVMENEPVSPRLLNASISRDLETICLKCLEKEPSRRYASAQAVAEELGRFLEKKAILARPVGLIGKASRWCWRKPTLATALGAVVLVTATGFVGILTQWRRAELQRRTLAASEYAADMNLAQRSLEANDVTSAVALLNKHRPAFSKPSTLNSQPSIDLRGWEWRYLWQLCQPDVCVRLQTNAASIGKVAISQDGQVLAVQTAGDKIVLWDLTSKRQKPELPVFATIHGLALSPAGNWLAVSTTNALGKPTVQVWDLGARKITNSLNQLVPAGSLAFSPDETLLATFGNTGNVAVWEWASNRTVTNLQVRPRRHGGAGILAFSSDGSRLAIGEDYGRINLLNWQRGEMMTLTNLSRAGEAVSAVAFSPTTKLLAAGFGSVFRLWDADSGQPQGQLTHQTGSVRALAFTPDGQVLASASSDRTIRVWSIAEQAELGHWRGHEGEGLALAFLAGGKTLVSGCEASTACLWDVTATNRAGGHRSLEISYGAGARAQLDPANWVRKALDPKVVSRFGFTFTPDGRSVITTDADGVLGLWDIQSLQRTEPLSELGSNNWGVALSPNGHWLAVGNASGKVDIWDVSDWRKRRCVESFDIRFEWLGHLRFSRSGQFFWAVVVFNDRTTRFKIWRTADWQEVPLLGAQVTDIYWADFSPDDRLLATGYANGVVKLWDFPSGQHETTFTNHTRPVCSVFFSPDGRRLASTSWDGTVQIRDLFGHREVVTLRGHSDLVWGAAFSPDGRRLATGGSDARQAVKLWDLATQRELLSLQADGQFFLPVAFSPDGSTLMVTSFAGIAHLWRAPSGAEIEAAEKGGATQ
jgi:eukaryotic-like serine/threonine-protein kinase